MLDLDKESGIPYYRQLMSIIKQQVAAGTLKEGQQIPTEMVLSNAYGVNRHTVRQAVGELCRMGILYRLKGRGTFVANRPPEYLEYTLSSRNRFTENILHAGKLPGSKVLKAVTIPAAHGVAEMLGLSPYDPVHILEILRLVSGQPFLLTSNFLPAGIFPGFMEHVKNFTSLFAIYDEHYGVKPVRVKTGFWASFPNREEACALNISSNTPVLKVENLLKSGDNTPIQYTVSCYHGVLAKISVNW